MKLISSLFSICLSLLPYLASAQQNPSPATETASIQRIRLYNSKGGVLADKDSIIDKEFFNADGVFIQSDTPYRKEDKYMVILGPKKGDRKMIMLEFPVLNEFIKEEILKSEEELNAIFGKKVGDEYLTRTVIIR